MPEYDPSLWSGYIDDYHREIEIVHSAAELVLVTLPEQAESEVSIENRLSSILLLDAFSAKQVAPPGVPHSPSSLQKYFDV